MGGQRALGWLIASRALTAVPPQGTWNLIDPDGLPGGGGT